MKVYYYDHFKFPLPPGHRFPVAKYARLRQHLVQNSILTLDDLHQPEKAARAQLALVHEHDYLDKTLHGGMDQKEVRRLGLPWSAELVERARRSVGSTIAACRSALQDGLSASLGGGTHHAYPDHGQGFCMYNDVAVAVRVLQAEGLLMRTLILDCDVHQGNGTAAIFMQDNHVFTFSIHGAKNFPFHKEHSSLDIALADGTGDEDYLSALQDGLERVFSGRSFDLVVYLAGADPFSGDRLGRMALTKAGLAARDRMVLGFSQQYAVPTAITLSGGYADDICDIVEIHAETIRIALEQEPLFNFRSQGELFL